MTDKLVYTARVSLTLSDALIRVGSGKKIIARDVSKEGLPFVGRISKDVPISILPISRSGSTEVQYPVIAFSEPNPAVRVEAEVRSAVIEVNHPEGVDVSLDARAYDADAERIAEAFTAQGWTAA